MFRLVISSLIQSDPNSDVEVDGVDERSEDRRNILEYPEYRHLSRMLILPPSLFPYSHNYRQ